MRTPILPQKHVRNSESLLGLGAITLASIQDEPKNLDRLWADLKESEFIKQRAHGSIPLDNVILAVDFLFAVGAVTLNSEGIIRHATD